jgi:hypothetical protein
MPSGAQLVLLYRAFTLIVALSALNTSQGKPFFASA